MLQVWALPNPPPAILVQPVRGWGWGGSSSLLSKRTEGLTAFSLLVALPEAADSPASLGSCRAAFLPFCDLHEEKFITGWLSHPGGP